MTRQGIHRSPACVAGLWMICLGTIAGAQAPSPGTSASTLSAGGDVKTPLSITPAELKAMARTTVEVKDEDGRSVKYRRRPGRGVREARGATFGSDMRGNAMTTYVLARARKC